MIAKQGKIIVVVLGLGISAIERLFISCEVRNDSTLNSTLHLVTTYMQRKCVWVFCM